MASRTDTRPSHDAALALVGEHDLSQLMARAAALRDAGFGRAVSYSRKVFIPLTQLCRDVCHYCTFAQPPRPGEQAYLTLDEVVDVARRLGVSPATLYRHMPAARARVREE